MTPRLLCASPLLQSIADRAEAEFDAITCQQDQLSAQQIMEVLKDQPAVQALLISSRIRFDAAAIAMLPPQIGLIATCSVGYEHIDLAAARAKGIFVSNTPDVVTEATADLTLFLMLGALRRGREYAAIMEQGWRQRFGLGDMLGLDFHGKTLGIIGMGRIGQAVARRARAFGVKVLYYNRTRLPAEQEQGASYVDDVRAMLPHCQILSLHAPGGPQSDGQIDALGEGQLAAAGLDVFRSEPEYDLRFQHLPNVFMTPHMGTATVETRAAMGNRALDNVMDALSGHTPRDAL